MAMGLSFSHQSHFTSRFKHYVGLTPLAWVRAQRREAAGRKAAEAVAA